MDIMAVTALLWGHGLVSLPGLGLDLVLYELLRPIQEREETGSYLRAIETCDTSIPFEGRKTEK